MSEVDYRGHKLGYCDHCEAHIIFCRKCNNNTCNGGYGYSGTWGKEDYVVCSDCPDAYALAKELGFFGNK